MKRELAICRAAKAKHLLRKSMLAAAGLGIALLSVDVLADEAHSDAALAATLRSQALSREHGDGVAKDATQAVALYCQAARLGDATSQFNLGWIYANGRGVPRDDAVAAYFFAAAAEQGIEQAGRMLKVVGAPTGEIPPCMQKPVVVMPPSEPATAGTVPFEIRTNAPKPLVDMVKKMAPDYHVEPQLALAIMEVESDFDARATSPKNAMGLMQLIPETAARFNVRNVFDPKQNLRGGLAYLRWLLAYFEGDLTLVAAAYNAGEHTVERYRGVPPYAETRSYVRRIVQAVGATMHPFDPNVTQPSPQLHSIQGSGTVQ